MSEICLTGKCGSCWYFKPIEGTASGECHKYQYGDDVVHDPEHPYYQPQRSRLKCKEYRTEPITNYNRIVSKSPEELAEFLIQDGRCPPERMYPDSCPNCDRITPKSCYDCWLDWLKQEATDEA